MNASMPSPIGHALAGIAVVLAADPQAAAGGVRRFLFRPVTLGKLLQFFLIRGTHRGGLLLVEVGLHLRGFGVDHGGLRAVGVGVERDEPLTRPAPLARIEGRLDNDYEFVPA